MTRTDLCSVRASNAPHCHDRPVITRTDVDAAANRTRGHVRVTPVVEARPGQVWFKLELLQHTGTFKARGAFNRVLSAGESGELDDKVGIVVASGGNAGLANAYAAAVIGVPATVFVPTISPAVKVARLRGYGATVVQVGNEYAESYEAALEHSMQTGAVLVHAYDQPEVAAGAGVCGAELLDQVEVDTIVVAVGGGGLMAGVAAAAEGVAKVVAVEPATCPTLHTALLSGCPVDVAVSGIAADSLGARRIGDVAYAVATRAGVVAQPGSEGRHDGAGAQSVLVTDQDLIDARRRLWDEYRLVVEHGAAAAFAALTTGAYAPADGERVAVLLCGANTDPSDL
jgi:threonine dehydratase